MLDNIIDLKQGFSRIFSERKILFYVSSYSIKIIKTEYIP